MKPEHLYLHVPFCLRQCSYCDFAVTVDREPPAAAWLDAVETELELRIRMAGWERLRFRTIYVGGGTPSTLPPAAIGELRRRVERHADIDAEVEWTVEANPETFDRERAAAWRDAGVNRLSLGAQTFHEPALRWMGRLHGVDGPARAVDAARAEGLENVSLDLIFGLPARLGRDWQADLCRVLELQPEHVSLYGLTAEPATPLGRWVREGRERMTDEECYEAEYLIAAERLPDAGLEHYEVSSFGRSGRASAHNAAYWSGSAYLGLGPGAHSYVEPRRWWNERDWARYRSVLTDGGSPQVGYEEVRGEEARLERIWLGLRTAAGLARAELEPAGASVTARWEERGWAYTDPERLRLTPRGWLLLDRLAVELADAGAGIARLDGSSD